MNTTEPISDRRQSSRLPSHLPARLTSLTGPSFWGDCINVSEEGALVKLNAAWTGEAEVLFELDPNLEAALPPRRARVVRATSPDDRRAFLALQFLAAAAE